MTGCWNPRALFAHTGPVLRTLVYHRLGDPTTRQSPISSLLVTARPDQFERHLQHLVRTQHPVGAEEVLVSLTGRHTLPPRAVLVTFDDAYRDFGQIAWPLLRKYHVPVVLFVSTTYPGQPQASFWWDVVWQLTTRTDRTELPVPGLAGVSLGTWPQRVAAADRLTDWLKTHRPADRTRIIAWLADALDVRPESTRPVHSWAELQSLARDGVAMAAHSRTHELLDRVSASALRNEVAGSRDDLVAAIGGGVPLFAYPNGTFNAQARKAVAEAGFTGAFTTLRGATRPGLDDPLLMRRDDARTSLLRFAIRLLGPVARARAYQDRPRLQSTAPFDQPDRYGLA